MDLKEIRTLYFLGIGGIGMSALARYFLQMGIKIYGYDKTATTLTSELINEGMNIHFEENCDLIPAHVDMVIYTPAISPENKEFQFLNGRGIMIKKRAEILGEICRESKTIAISGSHGKTTTSTLIAHILKESGKVFVAFLGGISKNYETNLITSIPQSPLRFSSNTPEFFIVEADEFDRSFLQLTPYVAVITSVDADHLDIYGNVERMRDSFAGFANNTVTGGTLILKKGLNFTPILSPGKRIVYYSTLEPSDYYPFNVTFSDNSYSFDLKTPAETIEKMSFSQPGWFNLENAVAAAAVADTLGISKEIIKRSLTSFRGVRRRFDIRVRKDDFVYLDDYAHHPEEIKACINAIRETWPGKKITGVFQPHLYTRTRDFADEFAESLALMDEIILLDIYAAREEPIEGISSGYLLGKIRSGNKMLLSKEDLLKDLVRKKPQILLTMGAGNIDQLVKPIMELFSSNRV